MAFLRLLTGMAKWNGGILFIYNDKSITLDHTWQISFIRAS